MKGDQDQPADALRDAGPPGGGAAELRRSAEKRLQTRERTPQSAPDTQRLVHELQVHQIELEMQNEELRQARTQLSALMAQYIDLFEFAPTGYLTLDREGAIRRVNLAGARLLGIERSQLVNRRFGLFVAEGDRHAFSDFLQRVFASQARECCEVTLPQAGQHPLHVRIEGTRSADGQECLAVEMDLTERDQVANRERLARDLLAVLNRPNSTMNIIRDILLMIKRQADIEAVGIRLKAGEDYPYYETRGFTPDFVRKENHLCARDVTGAVLRDAKGNPTLECMCGNVICGRIDARLPFFTPAGSFWTNSTTDLLASTTEADRQARTRNRCNTEGYESMALIPLRAGDETVGLLQLNDRRRNQFTAQRIAFLEGLGTSIGIALSRMRAKETLQQSEEQFRAMFEMAAIGIAQADPQTGQWLRVNQKLCAITGYSADELLRMRVSEVTHPDDRQKDWEAFQRVVRGEAPNYRMEKRYVRKDRTLIWVNMNMTVIRDAAGQPVRTMATIEDITEQKKLEAQFLRAQRMESVGRLAGGIAHDLNNILAPILMGTSLLRGELPQNQAGHLIDTIASSAQRGADIVKQLLTFARGTDGQKVPLPPSRLIREMATIVQETFPKSIVCRTEFPKDLWTVTADPTQLHQVLLNLCVNARDAMPQGGTLTLAAQNVTLDDGYASMSPEAKAGPYVVLEVSDTGTGMSPETMDKIFEPFFTTKGLETGTGLGLATVHGIVKNHDGFIQVESQVGRGSHFRVYLPALPAADATVAATPARELPRGQGQLVLVVDDEPSVRDITRKMLEKSGYRVLTANEGAAAIALYTRRQAEIEVVLTDMMMPVMDGPATVRVLRGMNPQVKIIAASGAASKATLGEIADLPVQAYLQKPFASEDLLVTLDRVLHGEQTHQQPGV